MSMQMSVIGIFSERRDFPEMPDIPETRDFPGDRQGTKLYVILPKTFTGWPESSVGENSELCGHRNVNRNGAS
jgi:hypothetical protein